MIRMLREWCLRLCGTSKTRDAEIEEELRFHMEMAEQDALRRGDSPREARLRAGGLAQASESVRDQRAWRWLSDFVRDARYGARQWRKNPLLAATAIGSLALGIGANAAIFSVIDALLLRNLPVRHPEELVMLTRTLPNDTFLTFLFRDFDRYRALTQVDLVVTVTRPDGRSYSTQKQYDKHVDNVGNRQVVYPYPTPQILPAGTTVNLHPRVTTCVTPGPWGPAGNMACATGQSVQLIGVLN